MSDVTDLVPESKSDLTRARAAERAGYPAIAPVVNDLLKWLRDGNWPVAHVLAPLLRGVGPVPPLVGGIRSILEGSDSVWKYWVLQGVVDGWDGSALVVLEPQLKAVSANPSPSDVAEGVDVIARELLARSHAQT
ncbi:MAG: DUF5071 domain-containing protein [Candidatus Dormiibacterota bacterium]